MNEEVAEAEADVVEEEESATVPAAEDEETLELGWEDVDPKDLGLAEWLEILEDPESFPSGLLENMPQEIKDVLVQYAVDPVEEDSE